MHACMYVCSATWPKCCTVSLFWPLFHSIPFYFRGLQVQIVLYVVLGHCDALYRLDVQYVQGSYVMLCAWFTWLVLVESVGNFHMIKKAIESCEI